MSEDYPPEDYESNRSTSSNDVNAVQPKSSLISELKQRMATQLETTTGHGCPNLVRTRSWVIRIMWIILVIIATGASAYMIYRAITAFLKYDVTTQISTVAEVPTTFPTVTFCNINPLIHGRDQLSVYLQSVNKSEFLNMTFVAEQFALDANQMQSNESDDYYYYYDYNEELSQNKSTQFVDTYKEIRQSFLNYVTQLSDNDKKSLGYSIKESLITCMYNNKRCTHSDFNWYFFSTPS